MFSGERRQNWSPVVGEEARNLLARLQIPEESRESLLNEATSVLARTVPPTILQGQGTGLVVGYVQSGKTLSFTTVTALARDNNYPIIIVIAGTSKPLNTQSQNRLIADLGLNTRDDRSWRHFHNPKVENGDVTRIKGILDDWWDSTVSASERTTVLITVMKHHKRIDNLTQVFLEISLGSNPVLIIDDEADQAGLNNLVNENDESTTYRRLKVLRDTIPQHTFLQYTATPQGPLLINIIDVLSPDFAVTLTPGATYVGGKDIFNGKPNHVRQIPPNDIPNRKNLLDEAPESLLEALRIFFLGVASGLIRDRGRGNRSMMVHPSRLKLGHQTYFDWVSDARNHWLDILNAPNHSGYAVLQEDFHQAYLDLQQTLPAIESFESLIAQLPRAIRKTELYEVNAKSGQTPQIDWRGAYSHILVGGQALDRGFTVEGLTVTYMPRGVGARRADTIQQRARFFGYKRPYLGYCRVYLEQEILEAFSNYVRHEEDIRARLREYSDQPLNELRRIFLLPRGLQPTRNKHYRQQY